MIEYLFYLLFYFYNFFGIKYDYFLLNNLYCKKTHTIQVALLRNKSNSEKYEKYKISKDFVIFKDYISQNVNINGYMITYNHFPYNINDNLSHFIIWSNLEINQIETILNNSFTGFIFFKNIPQNKSIVEIEHYHIFVKKKN